jgi:hypothetical protein
VQKKDVGLKVIASNFMRLIRYRMGQEVESLD